MKIFYISVIEEHAGWGAEYFLNKGFIAKNNETITLDYKKHKHRLTASFLKLNEEFDVFFLQRGDYFPIELIKSINRPRFFWASELVSRCRDQDRLFASRLFKHIFVRTEDCINTIVEKKWADREQLSILLSGFDEAVHYKVPNQKKDIDILFIGTILPRRRLWLDKLSKHFSVHESRVFGAEMTATINRAKIVLNIHAEDYLDIETRVFEVLGCGSFLLTEKLSKENPFRSGIHLVEVENIEEMIEKIYFYLRNESEREIIASQGLQEALLNHTYTKRAEYIEEVFHKYEAPATSNVPPVYKKYIYPFFVFEIITRPIYYIFRKLKSMKRRIKKFISP